VGVIIRNVYFTASKYFKLKDCYEKAIKENKEVFNFEHIDWSVLYAKYVLEYLEDSMSK
jgi:hypothetical protein